MENIEHSHSTQSNITTEQPSAFFSYLGLMARALSLAVIALEVLFLLLWVSDTIFKKAAPVSKYQKGVSYIERDVPIYLLVCLLFALGCKLLSLRRSSATHCSGQYEKTSASALSETAIIVLASIASFISYITFFLVARYRVEGTGSDIWLCFAIMALMPSALFWILLRREKFAKNITRRWNFEQAHQRLTAVKEFSQKHKAQKSRFRVLDLLTPLLIVLIIYVPSTRALSGHNYYADDFHHWNYFVVGPALNFMHGKPLGTEAYSQYGVGFPVLFATISPWIPLTYTNLLHFAVIGGCCYFMGLYLFYRLTTKSIGWSCAGVLLPIWLNLFNGLTSWQVKWMFPSATILRSPLDILFFIALYKHNTSRKRSWFWFATVTVALTTLLETDSGIALLAALIMYGALQSSQQSRHSLWKTQFDNVPRSTPALIFISAMSFIAIMLGGLFIASKGTLTSGKFWSGWLEAFSQQGSPNWLLPLATIPNSISVILFSTITITYLSVMGYFILSSRYSLHNSTETYDSNNHRDIYMAAIATYGLLTMLVFIGRSHPYNVFHIIIPFSILATLLVSTAAQNVINGINTKTESRKFSPGTILPWVISQCILLAIFASPSFTSYPNVIQVMRAGMRDTNSCLIAASNDICGLSPDEAPYIKHFQDSMQRAKALAANNRTVAFLDEVDTISYLASGIKPWFRYSPASTNIFSAQRMDYFKQELKAHPPDYILTRTAPTLSRKWNTRNVRHDINEHLKQGYVIQEVAPIYTIWRRKSLNPRKKISLFVTK